MSSEPTVPGLTLLFRVDAQLGPIEDHGVTRVGHRRVVPILGGTVRGVIDADVLPGGADWQIVRPDGAVEIDTRYSLRTSIGSLLHVRTRGIRAGDPAVLEAIRNGTEVAASDYYFRLVVEVETSAPELAPLQSAVIVASASRSAGRIIYDAYELT